MEKFFNVLFNIAMVLLFPCGIYGIVEDYFIWDKSIVPDLLDHIVTAIGYLSLAAVLICVICFNKKRKR